MTFFFFFFNDTATTEIYTLSLHDALPIWRSDKESSTMRISIKSTCWIYLPLVYIASDKLYTQVEGDRKSTRLNSSHDQISYAVFCLKKKKGMRGRGCSACRETCMASDSSA